MLHLQNGTRLLSESKLALYHGDNFCLLKSGIEGEDAQICEAFCRLHMQITLQVNSQQMLMQQARPSSSPYDIHDIKDAWQQLQWLLNQTIVLRRTAERHFARKRLAPFSAETLHHQNQVLTANQKWLRIYETSTNTLRSINEPKARMTHFLLRAYHEMTDIMARTCLSPGNEMLYDLHTKNFSSIIENLECAFHSGPLNLASASGSTRPLNISHSIVDLGCIWPLYFVVRTAISCMR